MSDPIDWKPADTLAWLTAERDAAIAVAERWRSLCDTATTALVAADAEVARLTARAAAHDSGIAIPGWWCLSCSTFQGEMHSPRTECRRCGLPKVALDATPVAP